MQLGELLFLQFFEELMQAFEILVSAPEQLFLLGSQGIERSVDREIEFRCIVYQRIEPRLHFLTLPACDGLFVDGLGLVGHHQIGVYTHDRPHAFTLRTSAHRAVEVEQVLVGFDKLYPVRFKALGEHFLFVVHPYAALAVALEESSLYGVNNLLSWIEKKGELASFDDFDEIDCLEYGEDVSFVDTEMKEITLSMSQFSGELGSDSTERLVLSLENSKHEELASGEIEIYTGYITTNEDGNIGDGCVDECTYYADDIINYVQSVFKNYEDLYEKEKRISSELSEIFAL